MQIHHLHGLDTRTLLALGVALVVLGVLIAARSLPRSPRDDR